MRYSLLLASILISIIYTARTVYTKNKILKKTNKLLLENKKSSVLFEKLDEIKKTKYLLFVLIAFMSSIIWIPDYTGFYTIQAVAIFNLTVIFLELIYIDLRNVLFYNDYGFIYKGIYYKYKDVVAVGQSRLFYRLGKVKFKNGSTVSCFQEGLELVSEKVIKDASR